jgi:type I restriction enzyme S subunit
MSLPRYRSYKDSGVEWLGEVPSHWNLKRLRFAAWLNPSKNEIANYPRDAEVSFLPMEAIGEDGSISLKKTKLISDVETGYTYFRDDDVTIAKITPCFENGKGAIMHGLLGGIGFGTTELIVARPIPDQITSSFLHYIFISPTFRKYGEAAMYGAGGQKRVPDEFVRNLLWSIPPITEQLAINDFLDRETRKIDALVVEQERLIALLTEKRQAVISHAVTKGLNPTDPMKSSGIDWLGDIPAHWEAKRLRFLCQIETGDGDTADADDNAEYSFFVRSQTIERIDRYTHDCEAVLTAGDGVGVGKVFHHYKGKFCAHQRVYIFKDFRSISARFFFHYMRELFMRLVLEGTAKSTVDSLRRPMIADFVMTVPPENEQSLIIEHVETQADKFDLLIAESSKTIEILKERRTALISAAVTGKIDVRGQARKDKVA